MAIRLRQIVRAPKSNISIGKWQSGKVPRTAFPMAKQAYGLGSSFRWCVIEFSAIGREYRLLVVLHLQKQKFEAVMGTLENGSLRIICSLEYHATEPGWHCHAACEDIATLPVGYRRGPWVRRIPAARHFHAELEFKIESEQAAQRRAFAFYQIEVEGTLL